MIERYRPPSAMESSKAEQELPKKVRVKKHHPALKHAGYAAISILPGENLAEFEEQHRELIDELGPSGALEHDIVAEVSRLVWRKKNLETLRIAELARERYEDITARMCLGEHVIERIEIANEKVDGVREAAVRAAEDHARKELGDAYELTQIDEIASFDHLMKILDVQGRLNAMIDKCLKRLLFVRGLKSISNSPTSSPLERLTGPSKVA